MRDLDRVDTERNGLLSAKFNRNSQEQQMIMNTCLHVSKTAFQSA